MSDADTIARVQALADYWRERDGEAAKFGQCLADTLEGVTP
ncbi:hypothetical protein [Rhodococcus sp. BE178]